MHFADPKVAAGILVEQDGKVLLVRRVNEPFKGLWTLPAGFVDADEDPARAAERECLEETGLSVQVSGILDIRWGREHQRGADFVIFYRGQVTGGALQPGDDADEAAWFDRATCRRWRSNPPGSFLRIIKSIFHKRIDRICKSPIVL